MLIKEPSQSEINSVIALLSSGLLQEALDEVLTLTKNFPDNPIVHNITGACFAGLGQSSSAIKSYQKALFIKPDYAKAHYNLGATFHELDQLEDSVKSYESSIEIDPNFAEAYNNLGNVFRELSELNLAIISYEKAIAIKPGYVEAHFSLAIVLESFDKFALMVSHLQKAVAIKPNFSEAHLSLGNGFKKLGQFDDAVKSYHQALMIQPNFSEAHHNLGNTFKELGQLNDAVKSYERALLINPDYPSIHNNLGHAFKELGQLEDAVKSYKKALAINPDFPDSHNNLGLAFYELGKFNEAVESYERALSIDPEYAEAHNNLGVSLYKIDQPEDAIKSYERALNIDPAYPSPYNNLTVVYRKLGLIEDSIDTFKMAIDVMISALAVNPNDAETHNDLGIALFETQRLEEAVNSYEKALSIKPSFAKAHNNLGAVFNKLERFDEAINSYEKAFDIKPDIDYVLGNILSAKVNSCDWGDFPNLLNQVKKKIVNNEKAIEPFTLLGVIDDPALQRKASEISTKFYYPKNNILPSINIYPRHKKVRIGYFSPDFRMHPVGYLTAELYEMHDRNNFEIHAFSFGLDTNDELNLRIKAGVDHFHDVDLMSNKEIALLARSLEIDIAVDLGGFTAGSRPDVFALSAAPIQLSYIGYLGTMGANYYDYLIADQIMIPKKSQKYYSEKIVYLPSFQVNDSKESPPELTLTRKDLRLPDKGFVFCCFNNTYKFSPTTFDSWGRILKKVKGSVLIIYANNKPSQINLTKEIALRGVDPSRLIFGERVARPEYLARYRVADLFLDTLPYNAGTTASDALRMGLPVLTCQGNSYPSRMAASIINAVNLPELITTTPEQYESLAIELATDPDKYKIIKNKLVSNLSSAPLYDTPMFTRNLESAFTSMYERYLKKQKPDHIYV
jgi:protein O-GlcNAc transferase